MDRERWARIEGVFNDALDRPASERAAFLDQACAGDPELRASVDALLAEWTADPDFMETPLVTVSEGVASPTNGRSVGPFRVVRELARGGMGEVFLAVLEREDFRRTVALKVIQRGAMSDDALRRFRLERRILASLRHPNIAQLLDGGTTDDGRPYVAMEYVEGEPIDVYCEARNLPVADRLRLFRKVCDAVQYAHRQLVVHRDLKPANILVTDRGEPKLLDFGIGKLLEPDPDETGETGETALDVTRTGARALTPSHASPEQVRGERVTVASDVYQLGVLLYELLAGRRPHQAQEDSLVHLERAILEDDPPPPSARRRVPRDLDTICLMALRKEPERRYASAAALADDVGRYLDGLPVMARPDTLGYRAGKFVRRHTAAVAVTALLAVGLLAATVYTSVQSRRVAAERDRAVEVQGFLLEMFGATGPDQAGDSVTARQLLDRQADALTSLYADQPVLRARMMAVLADGYDRLGVRDEARSLAEDALALRRETLGPSHPDVAASLALLGWIRHQQGEAGAADSLLQAAVDMYRTARPRDAAGLSRALNDLGVVREAGGETEAAASLYEEALTLRRDRYGDAHRAVAVTASNLAVIRYRQGDYEGAARAGEEALAVMRRAVGPDHQRSIIIQNNLAAIRLAMGDPAGAEAQYRDLVQRQSRLQGPDHPVTLNLRAALASTLANQLKHAEAEAAYRSLLADLEPRLGTDHPQMALLSQRLADALVGQHRGDEALPILDRARAVLVDAYGPTDLRVARLTESQAQAWDDVGRRDTAETLHRRAVAGFDAALPEGHPERGLVRLRLAHRIKTAGRYRDALDAYREAEELLAIQLPPTHRARHEARLQIAALHLRLGNQAAADSVLAVAAPLMAEGADSAQVATYDSLRAVTDR